MEETGEEDGECNDAAVAWNPKDWTDEEEFPEDYYTGIDLVDEEDYRYELQRFLGGETGDFKDDDKKKCTGKSGKGKNEPKVPKKEVQKKEKQKDTVKKPKAEKKQSDGAEEVKPEKEKVSTRKNAKNENQKKTQKQQEENADKEKADEATKPNEKREAKLQPAPKSKRSKAESSSEESEQESEEEEPEPKKKQKTMQRQRTLHEMAAVKWTHRNCAMKSGRSQDAAVAPALPLVFNARAARGVVSCVLGSARTLQPRVRLHLDRKMFRVCAL